MALFRCLNKLIQCAKKNPNKKNIYSKKNCDMSSFIFLNRLSDKGHDRSEIVFIHKLVQLASIDFNVFHQTSGSSFAPMRVYGVCHACNGACPPPRLSLPSLLHTLVIPTPFPHNIPFPSCLTNLLL